MGTVHFIKMISHLHVDFLQNNINDIASFKGKILPKSRLQDLLEYCEKNFSINFKETNRLSAGCLSGTYDDAMEYAYNHRSHSI
jgi:hypothetical protein